MHVLTRIFLRALFGRWVTLTMIVTTALALSVLSLSAWTSNAVGAVTQALGDEVSVTAFLAPQLGDAQTTTLLETIAARPDVSFVRYQSPTIQRERLAEILGQPIVQLLDPDVIPSGAAIDIGLRLSAVSRSSLTALTEEISALASIDGVDAVPWQPEAIAAIVELTELTDSAGLIASILLLFLAIGVAATWAANGALREKELLGLCERFGATAWQRQRSFFAAAAVSGLVGALAAALFFMTVFDAAIDVVELLPGGKNTSVGPVWLVFIVGGPTLTIAGTWLGLRDKRIGEKDHEA